MPRKPKTLPAELPTVPAELLEQFGHGPMTADASMPHRWPSRKR